MMGRVSGVLAAMVLLGGYAAEADAAQAKFCFRLVSSYIDSGDTLSNGVSEDYWPTNGGREYRGALVTVRNGPYSFSPILFQGYLGDGLGFGDHGLACTSTMSVSSGFWYYHATITSRAFVNGNNAISVFDQNGALHSMSAIVIHTGGSGVFTKTLDPAAGGADPQTIFRVANAATYSVWRHAGGMSSQGYGVKVWLSGVPPNGTRYNSADEVVEISQARSDRKFVISHEMGHHLMDFKAPDSYDCNLSASECPTVGVGEHSMESRERSECAVWEGFAHFYAADVWNDHDEADCVFSYYKDSNPVVDCEGSLTPQYPTAYLINECSTGASFGAEIDWLRQFWDVHTDPQPPLQPDPTFTSMANWIRDATPLGTTTAYQDLDAEADDFGGGVNANWDAVKSLNGVSGVP